MTVAINCSWTTSESQSLDNLLHINIPFLEHSEIFQSTTLRPDNAYGAERCRITLTVQKVVLMEMQIVCSARHMEVYKGSESYLETVKGKLTEANENNMYLHRFVCKQPLDNVSIKFVSLQVKEKLDVCGIWLKLEEVDGLCNPADKGKLVNMVEVDQMLINERVETGGQAMLRQLISSLPANPPSFTSTQQANPLVPMMFQFLAQSAMSQRTETKPREPQENMAKTLLLENKDKDKKNIELSTLDKVNEAEGKYSSKESPNNEKESSSNLPTSSNAVRCGCAQNIEARLTSAMEEMEQRLQDKFHEMDEYRRQMDMKFKTLENKFLDVMKEKTVIHNENSS